MATAPSLPSCVPATPHKPKTLEPMSPPCGFLVGGERTCPLCNPEQPKIGLNASQELNSEHLRPHQTGRGGNTIAQCPDASVTATASWRTLDRRPQLLHALHWSPRPSGHFCDSLISWWGVVASWTSSLCTQNLPRWLRFTGHIATCCDKHVPASSCHPGTRQLPDSFVERSRTRERASQSTLIFPMYY